MLREGDCWLLADMVLGYCPMSKEGLYSTKKNESEMDRP
jgi:hypothetical protein